MAYKVFSNGDALTGSELNTYLMNQSVMVFASTTARDAALTAPTEGMVVWLQDSDKYVYYTGSAWADLITPAPSGNAIINGAFDIWQRGTTLGPYSSATTYVADRWYSYLGATPFTYSRQASGLDTFQYALRAQRTSGNTGTNSSLLVTALETVNSIPFAGKAVTLSFYARAGANYSAASGNLNAVLKSGTGTDQKHDAYTGGVDLINQNAVLTTSWQRFTYTATVGTTATELAVLFTTTPVGTAGAADYFEVTGVQLEAGSVATAFKRNAPSIQAELAACQRYYYRLPASSGFTQFAQGMAVSGTVWRGQLILPVTMRTVPTSVEASSLEITDYSSGYSSGSFTIDTALSSVGIGAIAYTHGSSSLTQFRPYYLKTTSSSGYIGVSAEL